MSSPETLSFKSFARLFFVAQALCQRIEAENSGFENLGVGLEGDLRSATLRRAGPLERVCRSSTLVTLLVHLAIAPDLEVQRFRERIDDRDADAVQTAGNL